MCAWPKGFSQAKEDHGYSYNGITASQEKEEERGDIEDETEHQFGFFSVLVGEYPGGNFKYIDNYPSNRKQSSYLKQVKVHHLY